MQHVEHAHRCMHARMHTHTHTQSILGTLTTQQILTGFMTAYTHNLPGGTRGKEPACPCRRHKRHRFDPRLRKIPRRREWQSTPIFLPGESHGQRTLVGYSPQSHKESDRTESTWHTSMHTHLYIDRYYSTIPTILDLSLLSNARHELDHICEIPPGSHFSFSLYHKYKRYFKQ